MKQILILSMLNVWSMDKKKGAPSFYNTIKGYIDFGWNVTVVIPEKSANILAIEFPEATILPIKTKWDKYVKLPKVGFIFQFMNIKSVEHKLYVIGRDVLKENSKNTIVYSYEVHGVRSAYKLSHEFDLPLVTRFQGTILAPLKDNLFNRILNYPHYSALKTQANIVIMTNDGTQGNKVLKKLGNKSSNIYFWRNGVDFDSNRNQIDKKELEGIRKKIGVENDDHMLLTVSRLVHWKKVDRAINALAKLVQKDTKYKLVIVGDGNERVRLENLSRELNLCNNVIFVGAVPQYDVVNYMLAADVFLSLYDLSNVGNPLLEAMKCGKPIITLDVGDTAEVIRHEKNGVLLKNYQLSELPEWIKKVVTDKAFANTIALEAKKFADNNLWNWDERISKEVNIVGKLTESDVMYDKE